MRTKEHGASHPHGFRSTRDAPTAGLDVPCFDPHAAVKDREWAVDVAGSREDSHRITGRCQGGKRASSHARRGHSAAHSSHCGPRHHKAASQSPLTPGRGRPCRGSPGCLHICILGIQLTGEPRTQTALTQAKHRGVGTPGWSLALPPDFGRVSKIALKLTRSAKQTCVSFGQ